jgi:hypothetical protein
MDQVSIDFKISGIYGTAIVGAPYNVGGVIYTYQGTDKTADMIDDMLRDFPDILNKTNAVNMLKNPTGFSPPTFQLNPAIAAGIAASGAASALSNLASNFLPPGLDAPIEAVKQVVGNVLNQLPGKSGPAASIGLKIAQVNTLMNIAAKGPGSLIFSMVGSKLLSDIPSIGDIASQVSLPGEVANLAKAASNPVAFAAQAASIATKFPMIDVNALAGKMLQQAASGAAGGIASLVPNMSSLAGGAMKMLPAPGKTPVKDAEKPQKTANPPKPKKPVEMKNLFAEGAAGSSLSTLGQSVSQFMGTMATIAPQNNMITDSASKTSYGEQKLNGNSNTANWSSGGYSRNTERDQQEKKRLELSAKIEIETKELLNKVDYSKLTRYSYQDLIKKHPRIKPTSTVIESLIIIEEDEAKANTAITTV